MPDGTGRLARPLLLFLILFLLPGCATPGGDAPAPQGWAFTARDPDEPVAIGAQDAFAANVTLEGALRQIGGQWHGALDADAPIAMRFEASVAMRVGFVVRGADGASASGTCDWAANSTEEKALGIARVGMRSTETTCEIDLTPTVALAGEGPTLRWEARARDEPAGAWSLRFEATGAG